MSVDLEAARELVEAAASPDPAVGLDAVVALRSLLQILEALQVDAARAQGWSWRDISRRLGLDQAGGALQARAAIPRAVSRVWERMSPSAVAVMKLAGEEAGRLGKDYIGDEHVLVGLLRHGGGPAAALLTEAGATLTGARAGLASLQARGLTPGSHPGSPQALQAPGIDAEEIRQRLTAIFGADAVAAAVRQASRQPWWRGGRRVRTPLCGSALLAKRALHLAALQAGPGREIGPEQLLYGVLRDIADPAGTQMSRRGRAHLAQPGRRLGGAHPALLLLRDMGVDPDRLRHRLASQIGAQP